MDERKFFIFLNTFNSYVRMYCSTYNIFSQHFLEFFSFSIDTVRSDKNFFNIVFFHFSFNFFDSAFERRKLFLISAMKNIVNSVRLCF